MAYTTFHEFNQTGMSGLLLFAQHTWSGFIPLLLFVFFSIIMLATYFSQRRLTGKSDFVGSLAAASYATTVLAFVLSLIDGLINLYTLSFCIIISILATFFLLTSKESSAF
jgi:hypothetical protein